MPMDEDCVMSSDELEDKYSPTGEGEHPKYTRREWTNAVVNEDTLVGYWLWVEYQLEQED